MWQVGCHATRNEIPPPPLACHDWLPLRGLGGLLARRVDQAPTVLLGHGGEARTPSEQTGRDPALSYLRSHRIIGTAKARRSALPAIAELAPSRLVGWASWLGPSRSMISPVAAEMNLSVIYLAPASGRR